MLSRVFLSPQMDSPDSSDVSDEEYDEEEKELEDEVAETAADLAELGMPHNEGESSSKPRKTRPTGAPPCDDEEEEKDINECIRNYKPN